MQIRKEVTLRGFNTKTVNALIDTGAAVTLIPKKLADELGVKYLNKKQKLSGAFSGGEDLVDIALIDIIFPWLGNINHVTEIAVSSKATDTLIGLDILMPLNISINTQTHELTVKNQIVDAAKTGLAVVGGAAIIGFVLYLLFGDGTKK